MTEMTCLRMEAKPVTVTAWTLTTKTMTTKIRLQIQVATQMEGLHHVANHHDAALAQRRPTVTINRLMAWLVVAVLSHTGPNLALLELSLVAMVIGTLALLKRRCVRSAISLKCCRKQSQFWANSSKVKLMLHVCFKPQLRMLLKVSKALACKSLTLAKRTLFCAPKTLLMRMTKMTTQLPSTMRMSILFTCPKPSSATFLSRSDSLPQKTINQNLVMHLAKRNVEAVL
mmetsp:Transcript_24053/g.38546  ORF Transcript_24053/g.38546 Transcript_24053/m.38546 type:complete len:229 (+) Transcript_24053:1-687(+)